MLQRFFGRPVTSASIPASASRERTTSRTSASSTSRRGARVATIWAISAKRFGCKRLEGEVLELPLDLLDAEAVRQGGVDVAGLLGRAALLPLRHDRQGAHVVEPVGELDDEHPPVPRHGDEHLAHRRGLLGLLGVEAQPVELGDPVHDRRHRRAELLSDLGEGDAGVLDGVVKQRRRRARRCRGRDRR